MPFVSRGSQGPPVDPAETTRVVEFNDVDALAASDTVATLLPACDLSTRQPLPDVRALLLLGACGDVGLYAGARGLGFVVGH